MGMKKVNTFISFAVGTYEFSQSASVHDMSPKPPSGTRLLLLLVCPRVGILTIVFFLYYYYYYFPGK